MGNTDAIAVWIHPRSHRNVVEGMRNDAVLIRLTAPPVNGAANRALVTFVAQHLGVRASEVALVRGERSRRKRIAVEGLPAATLRCRLLDPGLAT
jgi:uncharacterized protein